MTRQTLHPAARSTESRLIRRAESALRGAIAAHAESDRRAEFLRGFHRLTRETIESETPEAARVVLRELERALRGERARAGHWTYDLGRHVALLAAYRAEQRRAARIVAAGRGAGAPPAGLCAAEGLV